MALFSHAQLAILDKDIFADNTIPWSAMQANTVYEALDTRYRLLDTRITWSDVEASSFYTALDARYRRRYRIVNEEYINKFGNQIILANAPLSWFDPQVFVNGLMQGASHFTLAAQTITFDFSLSGDDVQVVYACEEV